MDGNRDLCPLRPFLRPLRPCHKPHYPIWCDPLSACLLRPLCSLTRRFPSRPLPASGRAGRQPGTRLSAAELPHLRPPEAGWPPPPSDAAQAGGCTSALPFRWTIRNNRHRMDGAWHRQRLRYRSGLIQELHRGRGAEAVEGGVGVLWGAGRGIVTVPSVRRQLGCSYRSGRRWLHQHRQSSGGTATTGVSCLTYTENGEKACSRRERPPKPP